MCLNSNTLMAFIICATYVRSKYVIRKYNGQARFRVLSRWNNPPFNQKNFFDVKFDVHQYFFTLIRQCITRWATFPSFKEFTNSRFQKNRNFLKKISKSGVRFKLEGKMLPIENLPTWNLPGWWKQGAGSFKVYQIGSLRGLFFY